MASTSLSTRVRASLALLALGMLIGPNALAQRGGLPQAPARPGLGRMGTANPIAPLISLRRELNLTPRQLVALDSIERGLLQRNRTLQQRLAAQRDSLLRAARSAQTREERQALRARLIDSLRPLRQQIARNDSVARAQAMAILTDSQRARVREFQAERRGFVRGLALGRGMRGPRGAMLRPPLGGRMLPPGATRGRPAPWPRYGERLGPQALRGWQLPAPRRYPMGPGWRRPIDRDDHLDKSNS
jgi:hypothetical protein